MGTILICSTPVYGHVAPMTAIGGHLTQQGHRVRILTGSRFAESARAAGIEHVPLPAGADYDDREMDAAFPEAYGKTGLEGARTALGSVFIAPIPHQFRALEEQIAVLRPDIILTDVGFAGVLPLLLGDAPRPPVVSCGVYPLSMSSKDTAPFGMGLHPLAGRPGRMRNALLYGLRHVIFRDLQERANRIMEDLAGRKLPAYWMDGPKLADRFMQLTAPGFEYLRTDLPPNTQFVGPVLPPASTSFQEPGWWPDLEEESRTVVHVSQGTVDNADLGQLVGVTLRALAEEDVLVVATTGGRPISAIPGPLPSNARVSEFIPYDLLMPRTDVMVTNGGYGGIQFALSHGVPLVMAGDTADKPEIAARVTWSGTGISLKTGTPTPQAVAAAVRTVLMDSRFKDAAERISTEMRACSALETIAAVVETYVEASHRAVRPLDV